MIEFVELPTEIYLEIFRYLKIKDLKQISRTCNKLRDIIILLSPKEYAKKGVN